MSETSFLTDNSRNKRNERKSIDKYGGVKSASWYGSSNSYYLTAKIKLISGSSSKPLPYEELPINIEIQNYIFSIPRELREIADAILESKSLLDEANACDDASAVNFDAYINGITFLYKYSVFLFKEKQKILATPYIDSMMNGDVYLDWKTEKADFLIIFKKDKSISYFYGENKQDKIPLKSAIQNRAPVKSFLIEWLRDNLCN